MNVHIKVIPHKQHRYETVGDWWFTKNGDIEIRVSDMKNWKYETLVALHELVEVCLCKDRGIKTKVVDAFDKNFEKERAKGLHGEGDEPGDAIDAPYRKEHFFATNVERLFSEQLNVHWDSYDKTVMGL